MCFLILKGKIYMNTNYLKSIINDIFLSDSPSGYYKKVDSVIYDKVKEMGYDDILVDDKGMVRIFIKGVLTWLTRYKKSVISQRSVRLGQGTHLKRMCYGYSSLS